MKFDDMIFLKVHRPEVGLFASPTPKKPQTKAAMAKTWIKDKVRNGRIRYYTAKINYIERKKTIWQFARCFF